MTKQEQENWEKKKKGDIFIANEYFHHHSKEKLRDGFKDEIRKALTTTIEIEPMIRKRKKGTVLLKGITAGKLNKNLKNELEKNIKNLMFEVEEKDGVYYSGKKTAGFDFAIIDDENNLINLYNNCFGNKHYHDGEKRWNKFLRKNKSLKIRAKAIRDEGVLGKDLALKNKEAQIIVGEMQYGNWALVYRDFFKLLKANIQTNVDCLIFITDTNYLEELLSNGIVTFNKTKKLLIEFPKVINVPIWLIGLDIKNIKE